MKRPIIYVLCFYLLGLIIYINFKMNLSSYLLVFILTILIFNFLPRKYKYISSFIALGFIRGLYMEDRASFYANSLELEGYIYQINQIDSQIDAGEKSYQYFIRLKKLNGRRVDIRTKFYYQDLLEYGRYYRINGNLQPITSKDNFKSFNYKNYLKSKKIFSALEANKISSLSKFNKLVVLKGKAYTFLENNLSKNLKGDSLDFAKTLVLGQNFIEQQEKDLYSKIGLSHILAISGLHLSIIISLLEILGQYSGLKRPMYTIIIAFLLALYGYVISFPVSMLRALIMYILRKMAIFRLKVQDDLNLISFTGLLIIVINPFTIYTPALFLSFSAIIGLFIIQKYLINIFHPKSWIGKNLIQNLSIQLTLFPIQIYYFNRFNLISILANLLIIPIASIPVASSFAISSGLAKGLPFLVWIYMGSISIISNLAVSISSIEYSYLFFPSYDISQLFGFYIVLCLALKIRPLLKIYRKYKKQTIVIVLGLLFTSPFFNYFIIDARLNLIDVGQGDSILIRTPYTNSLIDTGGDFFNKERSGKDLVDYLKKNGVFILNNLFLTHKDIDHSGNLEYLLENIRVDRVFIGQKYEVDYKNEIFHRLKEGDKIFLSKKVHLEVLLDGSQADNENDSSLVMNLNVNGKNTLLTGDMENHEDLIRDYKIDFLKVSHHGSKNATNEDLLKRTRPDIALISAGENNRYGHPHEKVIDRLTEYGVKIYSTNIDGNIEIIFHKNKYLIRTKNEKIDLSKIINIFQ